MWLSRSALVGAAVGALAVGGWVLSRDQSNGERWGVLGTSFDPVATATACQDVADGEIGYALRSDASPDPTMVNVYATVESRNRALRVADCLRNHGAQNVEVSLAEPVQSFSPN